MNVTDSVSPDGRLFSVNYLVQAFETGKFVYGRQTSEKGVGLRKIASTLETVPLYFSTFFNVSHSGCMRNAAKLLVRSSMLS